MAVYLIESKENDPFDYEQQFPEDKSADEMDVYVLTWLFDMSSNPSVQTIIVQSIGALLLASVKPLKQCAKGILEFYNAVASLIHFSIEEGKFDCLTHAGFCLGSAHYTFTVDSFWLSILVIFLVIIWWRFAPIVWGYLLQKLLPLDSQWENSNDRRLIQPLFHAISLSYWPANYKPSPLFLGSDKLEMCLTSDSIDKDDRGTCPVTLEVAIHKYLFLYVAHAIILCFRDAVNNLFHLGPVTEFPSPGDPQLCALLTMASSPFIHTVPMINPSIDTFFGIVMLNIATFMGVHESDLLDNNFPSFKLDANRHSVLKLLYTLISSQEFGDVLMHSSESYVYR
ncbi:hypothetical protein IW261DRAFT_1566604 [Armillaria novae-zelandiae]|uniref:Uncharacterized protein n=1 Tax=Armillaria novae-zelandiae TaxID=153914 RepID=A0AA39U458_9AGAR|nr:hypothetical protein IW261DRAFT_1566604 [Armillaria novae-zelandiae]